MQLSDIQVTKTTSSVTTLVVELSATRTATLVLPSDLTEVETYKLIKLVSSSLITSAVIQLTATRVATLLLPINMTSAEVNKLTYLFLNTLNRANESI